MIEINERFMSEASMGQFRIKVPKRSVKKFCLIRFWSKNKALVRLSSLSKLAYTDLYKYFFVIPRIPSGLRQRKETTSTKHWDLYILRFC